MTEDIQQQGKAVVEALGGRWTGRAGMCRCPAHADTTPSLSIRLGRTRLLLHCFAGCRSDEVLRSLLGSGLLRGSAGSTAAVLPEPRRGDAEAARALWTAAGLLAGTPAELWLRRRGLPTDSPALRYHPAVPRGPRRTGVVRPALLAAVEDSRGLTGIQRSFFRPDGTGVLVADGRRALGRYGGGAVRLHPPCPVLGLAEGVETALAASTLFGVPCWAMLGSARLTHAELPAVVTRLLIFADNDPAGRRAAGLARAAYRHAATVEVHCPGRPGDDWNDVLLARRGQPGEESGRV